MQVSLCLAQLVVRPSHVLNQFLKVHILLELNVSEMILNHYQAL